MAVRLPRLLEGFVYRHSLGETFSFTVRLPARLPSFTVYSLGVVNE
jgi:hypothetical protein